MSMLAQLLPAVSCLSMMADYTSAGFLDTDAAPGGWAPKDGAGVVRFSALGLFPEPGTLVPTIAEVRPSRIPSLCTRSTRAGIEWCCCHRAVFMARPR